MRVVISGARAPSVWRVALALLSRQVICLNLMGWIIGSFAYLGLFFYFWALSQSNYFFSIFLFFFLFFMIYHWIEKKEDKIIEDSNLK
jgi:protein-S-isoprenylcysteine O-methyltransferase Ste14